MNSNKNKLNNEIIFIFHPNLNTHYIYKFYLFRKKMNKSSKWN